MQNVGRNFFMNRLLSIFLLSLPLKLSAQHENIDRKIKNADSIILISHKISWEYEAVEEGKSKNAPLFLSKGDVNPQIILSRRILLDRTQIIDILHVENGTYKHVARTCDQPRNSILIYKKAKLSYIDICFHCERIHTSDDLNHVVIFDHARFEKLASYFESLNLIVED